MFECEERWREFSVRLSDAQLLSRWSNGDQTAAHVLLERYFESLARFFFNKVSGGHEDFIQRTMLRALENRGRLRSCSSFRSYLFAIAHNLVVDHYRGAPRREAWVARHESMAAVEPSPSAMLVAAESQTQLLAALRQLPFELQVIVELRYWEQLRGPELAEVLGIPEGTVRSRLRRALALLRQALESANDEPLPEFRSSVPSLDAWSRRTRALAEVGSCGLSSPSARSPRHSSS